MPKFLLFLITILTLAPTTVIQASDFERKKADLLQSFIDTSSCYINTVAISYTPRFGNMFFTEHQAMGRFIVALHKELDGEEKNILSVLNQRADKLLITESQKFNKAPKSKIYGFVKNCYDKTIQAAGRYKYKNGKLGILTDEERYLIKKPRLDKERLAIEQKKTLKAQKAKERAEKEKAYTEQRKKDALVRKQRAQEQAKKDAIQYKNLKKKAPKGTIAILKKGAVVCVSHGDEARTYGDLYKMYAFKRSGMRKSISGCTITSKPIYISSARYATRAPNSIIIKEINDSLPLMTANYEIIKL